MLPGRIRAHIGDALVRREEHPTVMADPVEDDDVRRACEGFVANRVGLMARRAQVVEQLGGKILFQLVDGHQEARNSRPAGAGRLQGQVS